MVLRPLGLWNDSWRDYALGVLLICMGASVICSFVFWMDLPRPRVLVAAMAVAAGTGVGLFGGLCAGVAYRVIDADSHPLVRWLGLSLVTGSVQVALLLILLGDPILLMLQVTAPLIALHAGWSGLFLIGRRPRPPRQPLPLVPQPLPRGWDSRH